MPRTSRTTTVHPMAIRRLEVLRVEDVTPGMRRITLTGEQLGAWTNEHGYRQVEFVSSGFDDDVRVFFAYPGQVEPVLPVLTNDGVTHPKDPAAIGRYYTIRRYDPVAREVDLDFVRHGIGIATTWAYRAAPGDFLYIAGPSASLALPVAHDWLLIVGDETALPAVGRLLDELPGDARAKVFLEVAESDHRQQLRELPGVEVTWLVRDAPDAVTLLDAVRSAAWAPGSVFAWIAGEQSVVRDVRRHLVEDRGLDKRDIDFTGYWKKSTVVALDGDSAIPDVDNTPQADDKFYDQADALPSLVIRTAVNIRVADHMLRGIRSVAQLAARTETDERALAKLLRYMQTIDLVVPDGDGFRLSETGEYLVTDYVVDSMRRDGVAARRRRALEGLEYSIRTGSAAYARVTGRDFSALRRDPSFEHAFLDDLAEHAAYDAESLAKLPELAGLDHVVVQANIGGAVAAAITGAHADTRVTIAALPTAAEWLRKDLPSTVPDESQRARIAIVEQSIFEKSPPADAVLIIGVLEELPDAEAALALRRAADSLTKGGRVLLLQEILRTDEIDVYEAEEDLLNLTLHGSGCRTADELDAVISAAGLRTAATALVASGDLLRTLE